MPFCCFFHEAAQIVVQSYPCVRRCKPILGMWFTQRQDSDSFQITHENTGNEPRHDKTNKRVCAQRRLRSAWASRPVLSESSLCAWWVAKGPKFLHADSEDSDQTGRTLTLLVLSCRGSNDTGPGSSVRRVPTPGNGRSQVRSWAATYQSR